MFLLISSKDDVQEDNEIVLIFINQVLLTNRQLDECYQRHRNVVYFPTKTNLMWRHNKRLIVMYYSGFQIGYNWSKLKTGF